MASNSGHLTPDFKGPRGTGSAKTPDAGAPRSTYTRGAYPADKGGPPQTNVGRPGRQGDPKTPEQSPNAQVPRIPPRKTTRANTTTNPLR